MNYYKIIERHWLEYKIFDLRHAKTYNSQRLNRARGERQSIPDYVAINKEGMEEKRLRAIVDENWEEVWRCWQCLSGREIMRWAAHTKHDDIIEEFNQNENE